MKNLFCQYGRFSVVTHVEGGAARLVYENLDGPKQEVAKLEVLRPEQPDVKGIEGFEKKVDGDAAVAMKGAKEFLGKLGRAGMNVGKTVVNANVDAVKMIGGAAAAGYEKAVDKTAARIGYVADVGSQAVRDPVRAKDKVVGDMIKGITDAHGNVTDKGADAIGAYVDYSNAVTKGAVSGTKTIGGWIRNLFTRKSKR